jgi:hypothetical protein
MVSVAQAHASSTQPVSPSTLIADESGDSFFQPHSSFTSLIDADDSAPVPAVSPDPTTQPAEPQVINNPLPPAFWSGMSMLVLASALLAWRRLRRQLW